MVPSVFINFLNSPLVLSLVFFSFSVFKITNDKSFMKSTHLIPRPRPRPRPMFSFRQAELVDSGVYECQVSANPKLSKLVNLQVKGRIKILICMCSL